MRKCRDCRAAISDPTACRCVICTDTKNDKRREKTAAENERTRAESNALAAVVAVEGILALHRVCRSRDRVNRLEEAYDKLAKRFAERRVSALPPERPERLGLEDLPPIPPVLDFPDTAAPPDWPRKPLKSLKQKDWNYEDSLSDVYAFAMWFYLKNVPHFEFRSHEKRWQGEGLPFTIALTEWLQRHEIALRRDDEAMRRAVIALRALVKERAPALLHPPEAASQLESSEDDNLRKRWESKMVAAAVAAAAGASWKYPVDDMYVISLSSILHVVPPNMEELWHEPYLGNQVLESLNGLVSWIEGHRDALYAAADALPDE